MQRPVLLDLFCGAGGAAMGYYRAGFDVVGVDLNPQPRYPFRFIQADALSFPLDSYDAIHASPPCQDYTRGKHIRPAKCQHKYPRLIGPMRQRLAAVAVPWVIENVEDAYPEMPDSMLLCGTMFGLRVWRHRLFSASFLHFAAAPCNHHIPGCISVRRKHAEYIGVASGVLYTDAKGHIRKRPKTARIAEARAAMGIDWMTADELGEAIPPAYTEWLGRQLIEIVRQAA